jgi:hypothetical protein
MLIAYDVSDHGNPKLIAQYDKELGIGDLEVKDDYVYTISRYSGLSVLTLMDNAPPSVEITSGPVGTVKSTSVYFKWLGNDPDGTVNGYYYSIDNPEPGTWTTSDDVTLNSLSEGKHIFYLKAVDNEGANSSLVSREFHVIQSPRAPYLELASSLDTTGAHGAKCIRVQGDFLYLPGKVLEIINISNKYNPGVVGSLDFNPHDIRSIEVEGSFVYGCDSDNGLFIIDVSNPALPFVTGRLAYEKNHLFQDIEYKDNYVYMVGKYLDTGLKVIDVSDRSNPVEVASYPMEDGAVCVKLYKNYVLCQQNDDAHNEKCYVFDISDPENPTLVEKLPYGSQVRLNVHNDHIYFPTFNYGLSIYDISDIHNVKRAAHYMNKKTLGSFAFHGNTAYIALGFISIMDISNPKAPEIKYMCPLEDRISAVCTDGNCVYIQRGSNVTIYKIIEVDNPLNPVKVAQFDIPDITLCKLCQEPPYVYLTAGRKLTVFDVSTPDKPQIAGMYEDRNINNNNKFTGVKEGLLYVSMGSVSNKQLGIIDISDPGNIYISRTVPVPNSVRKPYPAGDTVYVSTDGDFLIMDLSNEDCASILGQIEDHFEHYAVRHPYVIAVPIVYRYC